MRISGGVATALAVALIGSGAGAAIATGEGTHVSQARSAADTTISLRSTAYGKILVNSKGDTVYLWAKDKQGSKKSACDSACLAVWPFVLVKGTPTAGAGVNKKLLGTIKVKGGNEVTYNGWPLYTFASDKKPGQVTGEGNKSFGGPWWVVSAKGKAIQKKAEEGKIVY